MLKRLLLVVVLALGVFLVPTRGQQAIDQPPEFVPGEVLVQFAQSTTPLQRQTLATDYSGAIVKQFAGLNIATVRLSGGLSVESAAASMAASPLVVAASPNYLRHSTATTPPNDPLWLNDTLYGMLRIQAQSVWRDLGFRGDGTVVIADIDTGINYNHEDLVANIWTNPGEIPGNGIDDDGDGYIDDVHGIDTANGDSDPIDDHGHGTHTAGTMAAVGNNGLGVVGVNWNAKVLSCKFLDVNGSGSDAGAIACFNYIRILRQRGVNIRVSNNSWGGGPFDGTLKSAIDAAGTAGILNVFAAGNAGTNNDVTPFYPASFTSPSIIAVAASDSADNQASFSNYGAISVDLAAPGVQIASTYIGSNSAYAYASGTSMATPHVAGAAALLSSINPALTFQQLKDLILNQVDVLPQWAGRTLTGGRLNIWKAAANAGAGTRTNVALASNGGVASASSFHGANYAPGGTINGDRRGQPWGSNAGWNDDTPNAWPDWLEVDFSGSQTINEIDVFSVQDNYQTPAEPTPTMTFSQYGLRDFEVQYWTGAAWQDVPGGAIVGNNLVWREITFASLTTSKIRVYVTNALNTWSRATEVEAWTALGGNQAPSVSISSPANNATFTTPVSIPITAQATDADGSVDHVSFYASGTLIGTDNDHADSSFGVTWANVPAGVYDLTAVATDNVGASTTSVPVHIIVTAGGRINAALASNGGAASASSFYDSNYAPGGAINGDRRGQPWGGNAGWNDGTPNSWPDWLEVDFAGSKTIGEIDVFSVQDNYQSPSDPTPTMTFSLYGLRDFEVQYWTGAAWQDVPGGAIVGNNLVWRQVTFASLTTSKIRVYVTNALNSWSRVTEVEAWTSGNGNQSPNVSISSPTNNATFTTPVSIPITAQATDADGNVDHVSFYYNNSNLIGTDSDHADSSFGVTWASVPAGVYDLTAVATDNLGASTTSAPVHIVVSTTGQINVALASNGGVASASSFYDSNYAPGGAINGDRRGQPWGGNAGWNDGTPNTWPDWLEVDFAGSQTIGEVDVFSVQDNYQSPSDPTPTMTFSLYGLRDFEVQYWTGAAWQDVPGGAIVGNTLVWRQVTFAPVTTTKIRIYVTNALNTWSRITEVEAWTMGTAFMSAQVVPAPAPHQDPPPADDDRRKD